MASNASAHADPEGNFPDWIELHNPDAVPVDLAGWYLTDSASNRTKWQLPELSLPPGGYLVIFASGNDQRDPARGPLHANFALDAGGEYLGLIRPDGATVAFEYAPRYPSQATDRSYGVTLNARGEAEVGPLRMPTPGAANAEIAEAIEAQVEFSRPSGPFDGQLVVALAGAGPGQRIRYVIASGNDAGAEPDTASPEYTGPLDIDSSVLIRAAVFSDATGERGRTTSAHYLKVGPGVAGFATHLPVLVLDLLGAGELTQDGLDHASWLYTYAGRDGEERLSWDSPELATALAVSVRGNSSALFPKKSLNLKLRDASGGDAEEALLDLPAHEKWALVAPWAYDMNYVNNAFMYTLSNRLGRWAPRTRLAEVFVKSGSGALEASDYAGIYVLTDRIEPGAERVDIANLSRRDVEGDELTGGYILKIDVADADEIGWTTRHGVPDNGLSSVVLVSPKADEIQPPQLEYIRDYIQRMEDALHADRATGFSQRTYLEYIDRGSWVDHHLLNVLATNPDALVRSAYFTKDRGGRLVAGPVWDFDRALGTFWDDRSNVLGSWSGENANVDFWLSGWWGVIAQDPEFRQEWVDRWQTLRRDELSNLNLTALAQELASQVGARAAARDAARWPDNVSTTGSYSAQIDALKLWLTRRAGWIDAQFLAAPAVKDDGSQIVFSAPADAVLVYTLDGSDPRSLGGDVAPNAEFANGPLVVPSSANVHVRSYRAGWKDAFPGTPWSAAVGGPSSSPLAPQARLINISTRGLAGTGDDALIAGIVVADTSAKPILARAAGPALAGFGADGAIMDPQLSVFDDDGVEVLRNSGWENDASAAELPALAKSVGAFPFARGSADSALSTELGSGAHTLRVTSPSGQTGIALAEVYEVDGNGRTVNLSTRAPVRTGDGVLIGGFVVSGPAYKRVLIRAIGPTLAAFGLEDALADPVLTIYRGDVVVATNDRWGDGNPAHVAAASQRVGAFSLASHSEDAALLITLPPGAYTVTIAGKGGAEGIALLEIYDVP